LYPEGPDICHAVIIHPPGGIAGGDRLHLTVEIESGSRAVVTTPAATKWYKSGGKISGQEIGIRLGSRSTLDWLPQENLFFNGTRARSKFRLEIDPTASAVGWDMMMLGRRASGEQWEKGEIHTLMEIRRPDQTPLWIERLALQGGDILLESPQGLAGYPAAGTLWAVGNACTRSLASELNASLPFESRLRAGATVLPGGILLLRCLATEIEKMRTLMADYWMKLRPIVLGAVSHPLRLWAT
jgi:urease accessory protein